jgi:NTE family protein
MTSAVTNLVFEGTGVRNAIYAGGLLALEEAGLWKGVKAVAGTSSGAIVAALVSVGYSPGEVRDAILDLDFSKVLDGSPITGPLRLLARYGWHKGDYLLSSMEEAILRKTGNRRITFGECRQRGYKTLRVVGVNITKRTVRVFPDETSMDMPVADAVRISMSIPLFFSAPTYQRDVYVDGGVMWNYPLGVFDTADARNNETMGFHVVNTPLPQSERTRTPHDYFAGLFGCLIRQQEADLEQRALDRARTVAVSDQGIMLTKFDITKQEKLDLLEAGRKATHEFLAGRSAGTAKASDMWPRRDAHSMEAKSHERSH